MRTAYRKASEGWFVWPLMALVAAVMACSLPTPRGADYTCMSGVTPGTTTREELLAILGQATRTDLNGTDEFLLYPTSNPMMFNTVVLQGGKVVFIEVVLEEDQGLVLSEVLDDLGEPEGTTYSNFIQGSLTYLFPLQGLAFVGLPGLDHVYLKQCFAPLPLEDFMASWGRDLPTADPFIR